MTNAKKLLEKQISADELIEKLLVLSETQNICLLDSCGVSHLDSHLLIGALEPLQTFEITNEDAAKTLAFLDEKLENPDTFAIFTISYDFGLKLEKIVPRKKSFSQDEPDVFLAIFDCLIIHDYNTKETFLTGSKDRFAPTEKLLFSNKSARKYADFRHTETTKIESNFTKTEYLEKIEQIKEFIRRGDTYQTNLTQQLRARLPGNLSPQQIFYDLRKNNPAPFASFIQRKDSTVISASPERFFKVENGKRKVENEVSNAQSENSFNFQLSTLNSQLISTSPIKGTRPRGKTAEEDERLKKELLESEKDRAENVMIVDLLRNDLGRICEFGSVNVEKLCDLEEHPTLFHLVSTVTGKLREKTKFSAIIRATFPCGSITGAPKIRTMKIIDELENADRGLSMGAIGVSNGEWFSNGEWLMMNDDFNSDIHHSSLTTHHYADLSVAIRTMVIKDGKATFNVGGGIVIDSNPEDEYKETLTKAKALLNSINGEF